MGSRPGILLAMQCLVPVGRRSAMARSDGVHFGQHVVQNIGYDETVPRRLAVAAARSRFSALLKELGSVKEPSASIADRAVHIGAYNRDAAVLLPVADFERALEVEELLDDLLLELEVAERLARGPGGEAIPLD